MGNNPIHSNLDAKGLRYQLTFECAGIKCRLYAASRPTDGARVMFYVHGGAFIATLHALAMPALTKWAIDTNCVIVFPE